MINESWSNVTSNITDNQTFYHHNDESVLLEGLYEPPTALVIVLALLYGSISVIAVIGNSLVIWVVCRSRRMQNVTNCFIANLALADIVIALFAVPFQFQAALLQRWALPHFLCPFCPFVQVLSVSVSIFTLTAIAVERHRAILDPFRPRLSRRRARFVVAGIWAAGSCAASPMAAALRVDQISDENGEFRPFCRSQFSADQMLVYRWILVFAQYIAPLIVITCVYSRLAVRLWGTSHPGNAENQRDLQLVKSKKKVIKMLLIVVALFALCWLPWQVYNALQDFYPNINHYQYINIVYFACDWLAMSNSCYNPFIYALYNEKFKREFRAVRRRMLCLNRLAKLRGARGRRRSSSLGLGPDPLRTAHNTQSSRSRRSARSFRSSDYTTVTTELLPTAPHHNIIIKNNCLDGRLAPPTCL